MTDNKLKPCPFCGSNKVTAHPIADIVAMRCDNCNALTSFQGRENMQSAIDRWNDRQMHKGCETCGATVVCFTEAEIKEAREEAKRLSKEINWQ